MYTAYCQFDQLFLMHSLKTSLLITAEDRRVAFQAAAAIALGIAEMAFPSPLPGVKPGLANIVILFVLMRYNFVDALWVSLLRITAGSLIVGQFFSPGFFLALVGTCASLPAMAIAKHGQSFGFGIVSISISGAIAHMGAQMLLAWFWLVPSGGILYLAPVFAGAAVLTGLVNGLVCARLLKEIPPE